MGAIMEAAMDIPRRVEFIIDLEDLRRAHPSQAVVDLQEVAEVV